MKVFISVCLWGRAYAETFVKYALASQLSPGNIPKLAEDGQVTYHVVTTHDDAAWMRRQPNFHLLSSYCQIAWDFIEDHGFRLGQIPREKDCQKYPFMSRLQNIAFECSIDHDVLVFNYADFIWADGSLQGAVELMEPEVDAVLSFCLPVNSGEGKQALDELIRADDGGAELLVVPPRVSAGLACDHLHEEARLRMWDSPEFTTTPTYLIWPVADEGLVVRAYHQTVLALRVRADDPNFRAGIRRGSLDGYFSTQIAETGTLRFADDSDQVHVFSLYEATGDTRLRAGQNREWALQHCLRNSVSPHQREFTSIPIRVRRQFSDDDAWLSVEERSRTILNKVHDENPPDATAFLQYASDDIAQLEAGWRIASRPIRPATRVLAATIGSLGIGFLRLLRSLYVGRLLRLLFAVLLGPSEPRWMHRVGARTPPIDWANLRDAVFNLGVPIFHLLHFLSGGMSKALQIVERVGPRRAWGRRL